HRGDLRPGGSRRGRHGTGDREPGGAAAPPRGAERPARPREAPRAPRVERRRGASRAAPLPRSVSARGGAGRVAVVDVGSNSTRIFLCTGRDAAGPTGERRTTITGLRRGAGPDGALAPESLARLADCLADFAGLVAPFQPDSVVVVAT